MRVKRFTRRGVRAVVASALALAVGASVVACRPEAPVPTASEASITIDGHEVGAVVDAPLGVSLARWVLTEVPQPVGRTLLVNALRIRVGGIAPGGTADVFLDVRTPMDTVRRLESDSWQQFEFDGTTGVRVAGGSKQITVTVQDGGRGDDDGKADGSYTLTLALGVTGSAPVSPSAPGSVPPAELPQTAPGWDEARPAVSFVASSSGTTKLIVFRINSSGQLQFQLQGDTSSFFTPPFTPSGAWSGWTTVEGTGPLVGSPAVARRFLTGVTVYARGVDGSLTSIVNDTVTFPLTAPFTVSSLPVLPDGVAFAGSPALGYDTVSNQIVIRGSDGGLWMMAPPGGSWTRVLGSGSTTSGAAALAARADMTGADIWVHDEDHTRRQISYTAEAGWDEQGAVFDGGPWAGSPSAAKINPNGVGAVGGFTALADIDQNGSIVTEVLRGAPVRYAHGSGFVGSTSLLPWRTGAVVAAVRSDGLVALRLMTSNGEIDQQAIVTVTIGQPGLPLLGTPASGSVIAPGSAVTMKVGGGLGATEFRWRLQEVPEVGEPTPIAEASLPTPGGATWTVPANLFQDGHRYQWQASAYRSDTQLETFPSRWSGFTVTTGAAPAQVSPADGAEEAIGADGSVTVQATSVPGATGYRFSLHSTSSPNSPPFIKNTSTPTWAIDKGLFTPGGTVQWSVQAVFGSTAGAPSPKRSFTAVVNGSGPPPTPSLISPANGTVVGNVGTSTSVFASAPNPDGHKWEFRFELWLLDPAGRRWVAGASTPYATWMIPAGTMEANRRYEWTVRVYDYATRQLSSWPAPWVLDTTSDTLVTGAVLTAGGELRSSGYRLIMQLDGNLVVYRPDGSVQAATNRFALDGGAYLVMQGDGNLVEYQDQPGGPRKVIWASGSTGSNAYLVLQGDGNGVIYQNRPGADRKALWATNSLIRTPHPPPNPGPNPTVRVDGVPVSDATTINRVKATPRITMSADAIHVGQTVSYAITLPGTGLPPLTSGQIAAARGSFRAELTKITVNEANRRVTRTSQGTLSGSWSQAEKPGNQLDNLVFRGSKQLSSIATYEIKVTYQHPTLTASPITYTQSIGVYSSSFPLPSDTTMEDIALPRNTMLAGFCGDITFGAFVVGVIQGCYIEEYSTAADNLLNALGSLDLVDTGNWAIFTTEQIAAGASLGLDEGYMYSNASFRQLKNFNRCVQGNVAFVAAGICWNTSAGVSVNSVFAGASVGAPAGLSFTMNSPEKGYLMWTQEVYCHGTCSG